MHVVCRHTMICSTDREIVEAKLAQWEKALEDRGLKISRKKTEYLRFNEDYGSEICMEDVTLNRVENFNPLLPVDDSSVIRNLPPSCPYDGSTIM